jgi:hypothetical protein
MTPLCGRGGSCTVNEGIGHLIRYRVSKRIARARGNPFDIWPFNLVYEFIVTLTVEAPGMIRGGPYVEHGSREEMTKHAWVV